jgi:hypothetical protein
MRAAWSLPEWMSRLLDPEEREAVLGDLREAGEGPWQTLAEITGLVLRRQAGLWKNWRPWVAAFAVSVPTSFMLMGDSVMVCAACAKLAGIGAIGPSLASKIAILALQTLLLTGWSWTCGNLVGSLSRRTAWFSILSYCSPCIFCLSRFRIESLSRFSLLLFVLPLAWGLLRGLKGKIVDPRLAVAAAAALTAIAVLTRVAASGGTGFALGWTGNLILTWPSWCLAAVSLDAAREDVCAKRSFETEQHEPN